MTTAVLNALALRAVMRRAERAGDDDTLCAAAARHAVEYASLSDDEIGHYHRSAQGLTRVEADERVGL